MLEIGLHGESVQKGPLFQKVSQNMIKNSDQNTRDNKKGMEGKNVRVSSENSGIIPLRQREEKNLEDVEE